MGPSCLQRLGTGGNTNGGVCIESPARRKGFVKRSV